MFISIVGTGYVGLVTGTCLASQGHTVTCFDQNSAIVDKLRAGIPTIYEDGLEPLLTSSIAEGCLHFETDFANGIKAADVVFLAVGTPKMPDSDAVDMRYIDAAVAGLAPHLHEDSIVIIKSTVPPGTNRRVRAALAELRPDIDVAVVSNPEFLREGSAIADFFNADRIICGVREEFSRSMLIELYHALVQAGSKLVFTSPEDAELAKYSSNAFLALKVTFMNEIADLCEAVGANAADVSALMGMDSRIGAAFLTAGPGYGGSCFPKDTLGLLNTARQHDVASRLVETTIEVNDTRKFDMADRVTRAFDSTEGKVVTVLGVTFKANTDDVRDAPALTIIPRLQDAGFTVHVHDPMGRKHGEGLLEDVQWFDTALGAIRNADAIMVLTEWAEYRQLSAAEIVAAMRGRHVFDTRGVLSEEVRQHPQLAYRRVGQGSSAAPMQIITANAGVYGRRSTDIKARIEVLSA